MPEVCEVALTSFYLNDKIKNMKLKEIKINGGKYSKIPLPKLDEFNKLLPLNISNVDSKGKQMWFELKNNTKKYYIMSHFGMDGRWSFEHEKHANIQFILTNNDDIVNMYFIDHRNFGRIEFISNSTLFKKKINNLGPDFLKEDFTENDLKNRMKTILYKNNKIIALKRDKSIVKILMEGQKKDDGIGSGLGNYLTAEILYRAKIDPHKTLGEIYQDDKLIKQLSDSIKLVTKLSYISNITDYIGHDIKDTVKTKIPVYHKNVNIKGLKFCFMVYRKKFDPFKNPVSTTEIIKGRKLYYVPNVQK